MQHRQGTKRLFSVLGALGSILAVACSATAVDEPAATDTSAMTTLPPVVIPRVVLPPPPPPPCGFTAQWGGTPSDTYCVKPEQPPYSSLEPIAVYQAIGVVTASKKCPVVETSTGYWGAPVMSDYDDWAVLPTCQQAVLPSDCCMYVWFPNTNAKDDLPALCAVVGTDLVAVPSCEYSDGPNPQPGGGGCGDCVR